MIDPYRAFFPLGLIVSLIGALLWPLFLQGHMGTYPASLHADLMIGGFLLCFVLGFLMTAVPKFTGSFAARPYELAISLFVQLVFFALLGSQLRTYAYVILLIQFLLLIRFAALRFRSRLHTPPPSFVFVGFGILCGLIGVCCLLTSTLHISAELEQIGKLLFYQGFILSLLIGVGARLITALLGWAPSPLVQIELEKKKPPMASEKTYFISLMGGLALSLILEILGFIVMGRILRTAVVAVVAFKNWKLYKQPKSPGNLARCLWLAAWCIFLGALLPALLPTWTTHGLHLLFIGGFGLTTLLIASRVTFAHGGFPMPMELTSKTVWVVSIFSLLAALSRVGTATSTTSYNLHLEFAAWLWIVGATAWGYYFIPKMIKVYRANAEHNEENC